MMASKFVWVVRYSVMILPRLISSSYCGQRGVSMISLMIGLLVSMIGILAITSMHKSLIRVTIDSTSDARHDSRVASALMQLQLDLQSAGFGIEAAGANTVVTSGQHELFWRFKDLDNDAIVCKRLRDESYTDEKIGLDGRRLIIMEATSGCSESVNLASADSSVIEWGNQSEMARFRNQTIPLFYFTAQNATCSPYGFGVPRLHRQVVVSALSSAGVALESASSGGISKISYEYCLSNIYL